MTALRAVASKLKPQLFIIPQKSQNKFKFTSNAPKNLESNSTLNPQKKTFLSAV